MNEKKEFQIWLEMAERDFDTAEKNFTIEEYHVSAFYCQQSVEKGLKALVIFDKKELIKTHNLLKLGNLVNMPINILNKIKDLEPVYQKTRYPDMSENCLLKNLKKKTLRNS